MTDPTCAQCGATTAGKAGQKYCGAQCREVAKYQAKKQDGRYAQDKARKRDAYIPRLPREPTPVRTCETDGCTRIHYARGRCKMHHRRWATEQGFNKPEQWTDRKRSNYHARRARLNGARNSDRVMLTDIITRDGLTCTACGHPVNLSLAWPHRMSKSIDHTMPVSRGGTHTLDNCTLMHLGCNASKGARLRPSSRFSDAP